MKVVQLFQCLSLLISPHMENPLKAKLLAEWPRRWFTSWIWQSDGCGGNPDFLGAKTNHSETAPNQSSCQQNLAVICNSTKKIYFYCFCFGDIMLWWGFYIHKINPWFPYFLRNSCDTNSEIPDFPDLCIFPLTWVLDFPGRLQPDTSEVVWCDSTMQ